MAGISTSSPGKTILFGEHAVVYGYPAIAVPLDTISLNINILPQLSSNKTSIVNTDRQENLILQNLGPNNIYRFTITTIQKNLGISRLPPMQIWISSSIPVASGLGSSAAFAVCMTKSITSFLGINLDNAGINDIAYQIETYLHGTPSGIDNTVISFNKPVYFRKNKDPQFIKLNQPLTLLVADTGIRSSTKAVVLEVRIHKEKTPDLVNSIFKDIGEITESAKNLLPKGQVKSLGKLMTENHILLKTLGVSCKELDCLVDIANNNGALGAKLCGSGKGGNLVALVDEDQVVSIKKALLENGATNCLITKINKTHKDK